MFLCLEFSTEGACGEVRASTHRGESVEESILSNDGLKVLRKYEFECPECLCDVTMYIWICRSRSNSITKE